MRIFSESKTKNAILIASLYASGYFSGQSVEGAYAEHCVRHKFICHEHFVQAAKFICGEMAVVGKHYTRINGGAYVASNDIPQHLVEFIDSLTRRIDGEAGTSSRDVWNFLNDALRRYYDTPLWCEGRVENERRATLEGSQADNLSRALNALKNEEVEQSCLHFVSDVDLKASPAMVSASSSSAEESSSDSRKQHFLVEGGMLMRLFRFCPDCGRRLERAQLTAVGTAAVVRLSCRCSSGSIITKRWESQQRIDPHKNHAHFTGNVAASIASVTAGLRYADLQRWAEQMNLSLLPENR